MEKHKNLGLILSATQSIHSTPPTQNTLLHPKDNKTTPYPLTERQNAQTKETTRIQTPCPCATPQTPKLATPPSPPPTNRPHPHPPPPRPDLPNPQLPPRLPLQDVRLLPRLTTAHHDAGKTEERRGGARERPVPGGGCAVCGDAVERDGLEGAGDDQAGAGWV